MKNRKKIIVAITGASGSIYARHLLELLAAIDEVVVHGIVSDAGRQVLRMETDADPAVLAGVDRWYALNDFTAPMASGSSRYHGMVIVPCTMGTLAAIAAGLSRNLIHRAADVMLKERRSLVLAVRETPLNRTHLQNMLRVHDAGAVVCPAVPAFYHRPVDLDDMARHYAARLAEQLGIEVAGMRRWEDMVFDTP